MKQQIIWFLIVILITSLGLALEESSPEPEINQPPEINYYDPASIALAPPSEIDVSQAITSGNGAAITSEQWAYGDNLNFGEDLSLYPNAQEAVHLKHPEFGFSLTKGHVSYTNGILQNGNAPPLNLNDVNLGGTIISSLVDGGFLIQKGNSEGKFTIKEISFDLSLQEDSSVEVGTNEKIVLSAGASLTDPKGTEIISLQDETEVTIKSNQLTISGIALTKDQFGNYQRVGDFETKTEGKFSLDDEKKEYNLELTSLFLNEGELLLEEENMEGDFTLLDERTLESAASMIIRTIQSTFEEVCDQEGCSYYARDVSFRDVAEAIAESRGTNLRFFEEELGMPFESTAALGVIGMVAGEHLPSQVRLEEINSVLGFDEGTLRPFLIRQFGETQLEVRQTGQDSISAEVNVPFSEGASFNVIVTPTELENSRMEAHLDLGEVGLIDISYSGTGESISAEYWREIGPVSSSISISDSEQMQEVMFNFDLSRVFE